MQLAKRLIFVFLAIFFSCKEDTIEKYNITQSYNLSVSIYSADGRSRIPEGEMSGKLELINSEAEVKIFDIVNGSNLLDIPFGFYKAYVKGFDNCSLTDFEIVATGGNKQVFKIVSISIIPVFNVQIVGHEIEDEKYIYLLVKANTSPGFQYRFYTWGTNNINDQDANIFAIQDNVRAIPDDGIVKLWAGEIERYEIYKYYNVTVGADYGEMPEIKYNDWYELIIE